MESHGIWKAQKSTNPGSPNKLLRETSLTHSKFLSEILLSVEQNAMRNFARLNEISMKWDQ